MGIADIPVGETAQAIKALQQLRAWFNDLPIEEVRSEKYNASINAVGEALLQTRQYQKRLADGEESDPVTEGRLSQLWHDAATEIRPYNADLSWLCEVKGHGWADARVWSKPEYKDLPVSLDQMMQRLRNLPAPLDPRAVSTTPSWFPIAGVTFAALTFLSLMYLLVRPEDIPVGKRVVFDVWLALCLAASLSFIGGTAKAQGRVPWVGGSPITFSAIGGFGVFVVALVVLYPIYH
jgi:hypothetical protein